MDNEDRSQGRVGRREASRKVLVEFTTEEVEKEKRETVNRVYCTDPVESHEVPWEYIDCEVSFSVRYSFICCFILVKCFRGHNIIFVSSHYTICDPPTRSVLLSGGFYRSQIRDLGH